MNNYIILNKSVYNENGKLKDLRFIMKNITLIQFQFIPLR